MDFHANVVVNKMVQKCHDLSLKTGYNTTNQVFYLKCSHHIDKITRQKKGFLYLK